MPRVLQIIKENLLSSSAFLVRYFLSSDKKGRKQPAVETFSGHSIGNGFFLILDGEHDYERLHHLLAIKDFEADNMTVIVVRPDLPFFSQDLSQKLRNLTVITLIPTCLQMAKPLLEALMSKISGNIVIILANMSQLPREENLKLSSMLFERNDLYDLAFRRFFSNLKHIHEKHSVTIIALDQEAILGQKNSAFLRRVFLKAQY